MAKAQFMPLPSLFKFKIEFKNVPKAKVENKKNSPALSHPRESINFFSICCEME